MLFARFGFLSAVNEHAWYGVLPEQYILNQDKILDDKRKGTY